MKLDWISRKVAGGGNLTKNPFWGGGTCMDNNYFWNNTLEKLNYE